MGSAALMSKQQATSAVNVLALVSVLPWGENRPSNRQYTTGHEINSATHKWSDVT